MHFSRASFLSVVLRVAAYIQCNLSGNPVGVRFDERWRRRARVMSDDRLTRAFKTMLSSIPLRVIARLHRTIFAGHRTAVLAAGEMLRDRRLLNARVLQRLLAEWEEFHGECDN